ncbi:MAG TPA: DUF2182 domain-containing protein [Roseomonas sp.]|jgi:predicted metal-binding membrane protein
MAGAEAAAGAPAAGAVFLGAAALVFAAGVAATVAGAASMAAMGAVPMPGGWLLSLAWLPICGQDRADVAAAFLGMWAAMLAAMMLPSLVPALWRYRRAIGGAGAARRELLTLLVGAGYGGVWMAVGMATLSLGMALAELALRQPGLARGVPALAGGTMLAARVLQCSGWKARHLARCRAAPVRLPPGAGAAWRHGLRLGVHCACSCAGPTAILFAAGVMDLRVMAVVTAAITAERLAPAGVPVARAAGALAIGTGLLAIARAAGNV